MNPNIKIFIIIIISVLFGLGIGYYFAAKNQKIHTSSDQHVQTSDNSLIDESAHPTTYTCAMHPQIRQNEPGLCPICEMDLTPLEKNTSNDPLVLEMTKEAAKLSNIQTTVIDQKSINSKTLHLSGKIKTDERRITTQTAHIPGRVEKLFVTFTGEKISKGQLIATLYSPEFVAAQRELIEAKKLEDINPGLLQVARKKLYHWKIPQVIIDSVENSETINSLVNIYADASGVVGDLKVAVGDHLMEGHVLFDVINLNKLWVIFDAFEEDLAHIRIGNKISFTTPALPDSDFSTRVSYIDPLIDPKTRTASVRSEISNKSGLLKPEMFVKGTVRQIEISKKKSLLTVPKSSVLWTGKRSVVYIKKPNTDIPTFEYREVELGEASEGSYQVLSGLEAGEEIVTNGSFSIDAAAQLNNQQSMMNNVVKIKGESKPASPDFTTETPSAFKDQLDSLVHKYIQLKNALVDSDQQQSAIKVDDFVNGLEKIDMTLVKGDAHIFWMKQLDALRTHGKKINETQDIEAQRKQFHFLSSTLINTVQAFGTNSNNFHVQFCPMALDDSGADWIALEKEIRNPYFGSKMLKCGIVKGVLPISGKNVQQ